MDRICAARGNIPKIHSRSLQNQTKTYPNMFLQLTACLQMGSKSSKNISNYFSMQIFNKTKDVNFKTIVLEHADNLTYDSQYSLRRTIEQYIAKPRDLFLFVKISIVF